MTKSRSVVFWAWDGWSHAVPSRKRAFLQAMEKFYILIVSMFTWVYISGKKIFKVYTLTGCNT